MKTVVTGGAGFIGSHLVRRLLDEGREVMVADDLSMGSVQNLLDLGIEPSDVGLGTLDSAVDLRDFNRTAKAVKDADVVYHLAARIGSIDYLHGSDIHEMEALQTNLVIDANVLRACRENDVSKLVYASSVAVYPVNLQQRFDVSFSEDGLEVSAIKDSQINPDGAMAGQN